VGLLVALLTSPETRPDDGSRLSFGQVLLVILVVALLVALLGWWSARRR
jgi:hypothetical protein